MIQQQLNTQYEEYLLDNQLKLEYKDYYSQIMAEDFDSNSKWIQVKNFDFDFGSENFSLIRVLFMPMYLYKQQYLESSFGNEKFNLLDCLYLCQDYYNQGYLKIKLINFKTKKDLFQQKIHYESNLSNMMIQFGIIGSKYVLLSIQTVKKIDLHIFDLNLNLIMNHKQEFPLDDLLSFKKGSKCLTQYFDYIEPGVVYILNTQILMKVDLNTQSVQTKQFYYGGCKLLRLLPITSSEYNYYFKSKKEKMIEGHTNEDKQKIILFIFIKKTIYQLDISSLEILRETKISFFNKQIDEIENIFVIPIEIKNRQRKIFSNWTFLVKTVPYGYILQDWKEQNLFIRQDKIELINHLSHKYPQFTFTFEENIISYKNKIYINTIHSDDQFHYGYTQYDYLLKIDKKKGSRNYTYSYQMIEKGNQRSQKSQKLYQLLNPIIFNDQVTYPFLIDFREEYSSDYRVLMVFFYQYKEKGNKQAEYTLSELSGSDYKDLLLRNNKQAIFKSDSSLEIQQLRNNDIFIEQYQLPFLDNQTIKYIVDYNLKNYELVFVGRQEQTLDRYILFQAKMYQYKNESDVVHGDNDDYGESGDNNYVDLERNILLFSKFHSDSQHNLYLPIVFGRGEHKYLGIFDISKREIIEKTIHKCNYAIHLFSYFYPEKEEFILIVFKQIKKKVYIFFYSLNMINFRFQFINLHLWERSAEATQHHYFSKEKMHLFVSQNIFLMYDPYWSILIQYDKSRKFEVKDILSINLKLSFKDTWNQQNLIFYQNTKGFNSIILIGNAEKDAYFYKEYFCLNFYDLQSKELKIVDSNYIVQQNEEIETKYNFTLHSLIAQLQTGEILFKIKDKIYTIKQQY